MYNANELVKVAGQPQKFTCYSEPIQQAVKVEKNYTFGGNKKYVKSRKYIRKRSKRSVKRRS